ncbi:hypothetical protein GQ457_08G000120 [Hibiscus cannabinus]
MSQNSRISALTFRLPYFQSLFPNFRKKEWPECYRNPYSSAAVPVSTTALFIKAGAFRDRLGLLFFTSPRRQQNGGTHPLHTSTEMHPRLAPFPPGLLLLGPSASHGSKRVSDFIDRLTNQLTPDEYLSLTTGRGWPCASFLFSDGEYTDVKLKHPEQEEEEEEVKACSPFTSSSSSERLINEMLVGCCTDTVSVILGLDS